MVCAILYHYTKKKYPIYQHRPEKNYAIPDLSDMCSNLGFDVKMGFHRFIRNRRVLSRIDWWAGILEESFIKDHKVINSHLGHITTEVRGLDSL